MFVMLITLCLLSKYVHNANGNDDDGDDQKSTRFFTIIFLETRLSHIVALSDSLCLGSLVC